MENYSLQIIETIIVILFYAISKFITKRVVVRVGKRFHYQSGRIKITNKIVGAMLFILFFLLCMVIWGVKQSELVLFMSTILTILGIAFFAQWSIISNITSALIIFFNHPIKIGDSLSILDKDYQIEGKLSDIGVFFIVIQTKDGKKVTIPSNIFIQKMIKKEDSPAKVNAPRRAPVKKKPSDY